MKPTLLLTTVAIVFAAQPAAPVNQVIAMVRTALERNEPDKQLASALHKVEPAEWIDERVLEELESEGAGPKALTELERLRDASLELPKSAAPLPFQAPAPPAEEQQREIVEAARKLSANYDKSLPDFICDQAVRRYHGARHGWDLKDTLTLRLTYFERREVYKLLAINNHPTTVPYEAIGGAVSQGEFGSLLHEAFSRGRFEWDHWTNLRKRRAHVYAFRVRAEDSHYMMDVRGSGEKMSVVTGQHGFVYVDSETNAVLRIVSDADAIPKDFPVLAQSTILDYDFVNVGGKSYLLPLRAQVRFVTPDLRTRNDVEFRAYRKFGVDTAVTYGDPK
jgi:hypothetical protein